MIKEMRTVGQFLTCPIHSAIIVYLQYCSIIWASTYSSHLQPLFRLQKKALRIITHSPARAHTYSLFNKFKILNIFNIYKYQVSCFVFPHMQKLLPLTPVTVRLPRVSGPSHGSPAPSSFPSSRSSYWASIMEDRIGVF